MDWQIAHSNEQPSLIDTTSSKAVNYVRRNIVQKTEESEDGETRTFYEYEEAKISKDNWAFYQQTEDNAANIDYIAMMTGVEI